MSVAPALSKIKGYCLLSTLLTQRLEEERRWMMLFIVWYLNHNMFAAVAQSKSFPTFSPQWGIWMTKLTNAVSSVYITNTLFLIEFLEFYLVLKKIYILLWYIILLKFLHCYNVAKISILLYITKIKILLNLLKQIKESLNNSINTIPANGKNMKSPKGPKIMTKKKILTNEVKENTKEKRRPYACTKN